MMSQDIDGIISGVADVAEQIGAVAFAITDVDALAVTTPGGGRVGCLTEAIICLAALILVPATPDTPPGPPGRWGHLTPAPLCQSRTPGGEPGAQAVKLELQVPNCRS